MSDGKKKRDPVCGMWVDPEKAAATAEHDDVTYHFCAEGCQAGLREGPGAAPLRALGRC